MRRRFIASDKPSGTLRAQKSAKTLKREWASLPPKTERWSEENREKLAERIFGRPPPALFTSIFCAFRRRFVPERRACNVFMNLTFVTNRRKSAPPHLPTRNVSNAMANAPSTAFVDNTVAIVTIVYAIFLCLPVTIVFIVGIIKYVMNGWHLCSLTPLSTLFASNDPLESTRTVIQVMRRRFIPSDKPDGHSQVSHAKMRNGATDYHPPEENVIDRLSEFIIHMFCAWYRSIRGTSGNVAVLQTGEIHTIRRDD